MKNTISSSPYCIAENATISDALTAITENKRGGAVVVDDNGILLGIVSDGDVRRALVRGATELTPIHKILNPNVLTLGRSAAIERESGQIFAEHPEMNLIPITAGNVVIDVKVRESKNT